MNSDGFAELTGWVGSKDGFLVLDRNANGRIDDNTEMFGHPGLSGFADLSLLDSNADGIIDQHDAKFADLRVWRDLNQNGISEAIELFSLTGLGIKSIDTHAHPLDITTTTGNALWEQSTFTWADGRTGDIFEAGFSNDQLQTIFRGDRGAATWAAKGADGQKPKQSSMLADTDAYVPYEQRAA